MAILARVATPCKGELYMSEWICTDPDDLQYQRKVNDDTYEMVGIVATILGDEHNDYYVAHEFMYVDDYMDMASDLTRTYGYDDDWMGALGECDNPIGILMEMAFETYGHQDDGKRVFHSFEDAERYVHELVA